LPNFVLHLFSSRSKLPKAIKFLSWLIWLGYLIKIWIVRRVFVAPQNLSSSLCLFVCVFVCLFVCLSVCFLFVLVCFTSLLEIYVLPQTTQSLPPPFANDRVSSLIHSLVIAFVPEENQIIVWCWKAP
jgi:hypothetical protein